MIISDEKLEEFREIYRREYGQDISKEDAYESASKLLGLFKLAYDYELKKQRERLKNDTA